MTTDIQTGMKATPVARRDRWAETRRAMRRHWLLYVLIAPVLLYFA
ncbi:MAG: sugar ABC transporter permease, partial [Alphaproteobacteria bacterium]